MRIPKPRHQRTVAGGNGVSLAVQEWGKADGFPILFIHAFSQSHLTWIQQVVGPLSTEFNLVTFDNRGHGNSAKPEGLENYTDGDLYADDINAVINACALVRPVVVAWSIGGVLLGDYLAKFGDRALSGIVYLGAAHRLGVEPSYVGAAFAQEAAGMLSDDLATNALATIRTGRLVTADQTDASTFTFIIATNMVVPAYVRVGMMNRSIDHIEHTLPHLSVPVHFIHGKEDQIILSTASEAAASVVLDSRLSLLDHVGHAPHIEDAGRVEAELARFILALSHQKRTV